MPGEPIGIRGTGEAHHLGRPPEAAAPRGRPGRDPPRRSPRPVPCGITGSSAGTPCRALTGWRSSMCSAFTPNPCRRRRSPPFRAAAARRAHVHGDARAVEPGSLRHPARAPAARRSNPAAPPSRAIRDRSTVTCAGIDGPASSRCSSGARPRFQCIALRPPLVGVGDLEVMLEGCGLEGPVGRVRQQTTHSRPQRSLYCSSTASRSASYAPVLVDEVGEVVAEVERSTR